ncbi:MAG: hypothetical protein U0531_07860 [Dehalococcoidia bacterium]
MTRAFVAQGRAVLRRFVRLRAQFPAPAADVQEAGAGGAFPWDDWTALLAEADDETRDLFVAAIDRAAAAARSRPVARRPPAGSATLQL